MPNSGNLANYATTELRKIIIVKLNVKLHFILHEKIVKINRKLYITASKAPVLYI